VVRQFTNNCRLLGVTR